MHEIKSIHIALHLINVTIKVMDLFKVKVKVSSPHEAIPTLGEEAELLVDSGATYTCLPKDIVEKLGLKKLGSIKVQLANGSFIEKNYGGAIIFEGKPVMTTIIFATDGDIPVLGATTLEQAAFAIDPVGQHLVPVQAIQA